jgi:hypothetical protein
MENAPVLDCKRPEDQRCGVIQVALVGPVGAFGLHERPATDAFFP